MKIRNLLLLVILVISFNVHAQYDTLHWSCVIGGTQAGFLKKWKTSDGLSHEWFQYNDRGRGDSTIAHYRETNDGFITWLNAEGKDYFKKPVFEKFEIVNGSAVWENNAEKDTVDIIGKMMYVPLKISAGTSYRSYFLNPKEPINLIPSGKQQVEIINKLNLSSGEWINLLEITGTGLSPNYVWVDDKFEFFGNVNEWFSIIRKGSENELSAMIAMQKQFQDLFFQTARNRFTKQHAKIAITNANVFDGKSKQVLRNQTILIDNGVIREVSSKTYKLTNDYHVINASGKFVMAGLWDMHVHYQPGADGLLHLACGVTNVRDMGNASSLVDSKKEIDEDKVIGPRIQIMSGFVDGAGPFAGPIGAKISSVEEGIKAIRDYASLGYRQIKLYSSIKPEWVAPLTAEAKKLNLRVSGHIPAHMLASEAVESGYDEIQHMNMIFLNFYGKDLDTRTPVRFTTVAQKAAFFDFSNPEYLKFINQLKSKNIAVDPTVSIFESMFTQREGQPATSIAPVIDQLPLNLQRLMKSGLGLGVPNGLEETYKKSFENMLKMVKALHDAGVTIVPGTDDFAGFALHRELENYVRAGISNADVLKLATITSAHIANQHEKFGTIEKGKAADIILIDGNPLNNISDIRKVKTIIKDKNVYDSRELFNAISINPK